MKFLVMSDNHGSYSTVKSIVDAFADQIDYNFHCGDSEFPKDDSLWQAFDGLVGGNMDFYPGYESMQVIETPVGKVLLVHGHKHGVNIGADQVLALAKEHQARFAFFGHTHKLYATQVDGVLLVNPGSLRQSRGPHREKTFAIITTNGESHKVDYFDETRSLIPRLTVEF